MFCLFTQHSHAEVRPLYKNNIYSIAVLVLVWIILRETFSLFTLVVGVALSIACIYFYHKYLPLKRISNVKFLRLGGYVFYLIGQIYLAGFYVIKLIILGAKADVIKLKTKVTNESLKVLLADSITLTPGSILLDLNNENITLLCLKEKNDTRDLEAMDNFLKGRLENQLLKVQE